MSFQSFTGRFQRLDASVADRNTTINAAVSLGKNFRFLTNLRITLFSDPMASVMNEIATGRRAKTRIAGTASGQGVKVMTHTVYNLVTANVRGQSMPRTAGRGESLNIAK